MKRISERAVEIMIARHKIEEYSPGVSWFLYNSEHLKRYPGPIWPGTCDVLQALDEYQSEQEERLKNTVEWVPPKQ